MLQPLTELIVNSVAGAAHAGASGVAALNHKAVNDAVENNPVIEVFLYQINEILGSLRCLVLEKLNLESTHVCLENCDAVCHFFRASIIFPLGCQASSRQEQHSCQGQNHYLLHFTLPPKFFSIRKSKISVLENLHFFTAAGSTHNIKVSSANHEILMDQ